MLTATEELLKTHLVAQKVMEGFEPKNDRLPDIARTLRRTLTSHAWLQDKLLMPALPTEKLIAESFLQGLVHEHSDLDALLKSLIDTPLGQKEKMEAIILQIRALVLTHIQKEATVLYPLAEKSLPAENLAAIGNEMAMHASDLREAAGISSGIREQTPLR